MGSGRVGPQLRELASAAGSPDVDALTAHSARIGAAQDLVVASCSLLDAMRAGRWREPRVLMSYIQSAPVNVWAVVDRPESGFDAHGSSRVRALSRRPVDRSATGRSDLLTPPTDPAPSAEAAETEPRPPARRK